ncbi:hypothetical protein F6X40_24105 [Paraburkholderia sp. UCT31]|uniref:hypothetical protein n=1 Tax=Paraburkholderia sp. UCT31 TaxID=2615209 RepID=UPI00165628DC|nr:hypothetical protein [Paraburkholderia sp. UCT31]MBC8739801.1 hypothetical protein [Paraburkholderia sp. UCT31]
MPVPMKDQYVDEAVGLYKIIGTHPSGLVDVNDGNRNVFAELPPATAQEVVKAQAQFRRKLYELLCEPAKPPAHGACHICGKFTNLPRGDGYPAGTWNCHGPGCVPF